MKDVFLLLFIATAAYVYFCFTLIKGFFHEKVGNAVERAVNTPLLQDVLPSASSHDSEDERKGGEIDVSRVQREYERQYNAHIENIREQ